MVEVQTVAVILIIVGAALIMVEATAPGVFIVIPGTIILVLGIAGFFYPDVLYSTYAPILVLAVAIPTTVGTIKLYQIIGKPEPPSTTITESLVGKGGTVTVRTEPNSIKGKVKIDSEIWSAESAEPIEEGTAITVISAEGIHVIVSRSK